ncbi:glycosyltransferase family 4 protein [Planococcus sp. S3-L1]|uniref:glycosyltransferase family 4 protein n=1 Tax=Planococcus sp. S3-L1 TaxID=3046200 RepID=UPI0024B8C0AC|nr:glycosyltransferase family 4 protein [Planococcus sp. S3-L1]MDJ0332964.1 glycosyltransferase family 4 protein [Planococcus sp. S3-L1]
MLKKMKNIWFFHHYATPPDRPGLTRSFDFARNLNNKGYDCTIFSSSYLHYASENIINDSSLYKIEIYDGVRFIFIRTSSYKSNGIKRVKNFLDYYFNIFKVSKMILKEIGNPDTIIASSAHPLALLAGQKISKKYKIPCICEVRDLWPETFVAYKLLSRKNLIMKILYRGEKWLYKRADKLIFTMEGGRDYIKEQGWDKDSGGTIDLRKVFHVNNGVDIEKFNDNLMKYTLKDQDLNNKGTFKVIYTGSIRMVNNVKSIVESAEYLQKKYSQEIMFLIYGQGEDKAYLEEYCKKHNILNVKFKGYVEKKYVPYILSQADLNVLHFTKNSVSRYGASLNKMFEYFASGKPTISDCEFGYDLIKRYECGITIDDASSEELAKGIQNFYEMPRSQYGEYCRNSLNAAQNYNFNKLAGQLTEIIEYKN